MHLDMFCTLIVQERHCGCPNLAKTLKYALMIKAKLKKSKSIKSIFALCVSFETFREV